MRVGYCARENPGTPMLEVPDVMGPGLVLRNVQARKAVLANPTRVAKLMRTSKNFSILSMSFITLPPQSLLSIWSCCHQPLGTVGTILLTPPTLIQNRPSAIAREYSTTSKDDARDEDD